MENSIGVPGHPESIVMWEEDNYWIIKHEPTEVTTQGRTRLHAILMLADALAAYTGSDEDLVEMSDSVFKLDEEQLEFIEELEEKSSS